jgi:hypothetical protein
MFKYPAVIAINTSSAHHQHRRKEGGRRTITKKAMRMNRLPRGRASQR